MSPPPSSKLEPPTEQSTEALNEALAEIANGLVRDQQEIAFQDLKEVESIAAGDVGGTGESETASALARINSESCERMRERYAARTQELMELVGRLAPREAMIAVGLWQRHMQLYDRLVDAIMNVFQTAMKAMLKRLVEVLKNAYQKIKDIVALVYQSVKKLFS